MPFFPRKTLFLFFLSTSFYFFKTNGKKICVCLCVCACVCVCSRPPTTITKNNMLGAKSPWGKVVCFQIKLSFLGHFFALITALWFDLRGHEKNVSWIRFFSPKVDADQCGYVHITYDFHAVCVFFPNFAYACVRAHASVEEHTYI